MSVLTISVAGGGALGIGPLQFLCRLEQDTGKKISQISAAYAGTSTGSIIAAGLNEGYSAHELFELYKNNLKKIFTKYSWYRRIDPKCPTYDNSNLKNMLQEKFKGKISDWKKPIYIPTTVMNGESVEKVWDLGDTNTDKAFAILTSCSAPTYFDCVYDNIGNCYIDGGMWKNSPIDVLNAGLKKSGWSNYKILNLNTGLKTPNTDEGNKSLVGWASYLLSDWIARTSNSGLYETKSILGDSKVFDACPYSNSKPDMDDVSDKNIQYIIDLWNDYYDANRKDILWFIEKV